VKRRGLALALAFWGAALVQDRPALADEASVSESPRSIKLFDTQRTIPSWEIHAGPLWNRRVQDTTPTTDRRNFSHDAPLASEIGAGIIQTTPYGPLYLVDVTEMLFRVIDDKSFSWALFHQELGGGVVLGPLEPDVRVRVGILTADIVHAKPSAQLLTPGVSAGIGFRLGKLRVDGRGNADYLWRWFGADYVVRSFTIGLRLDFPPPKSPLPETP
jgi:hypothetical protein